MTLNVVIKKPLPDPTNKKPIMTKTSILKVEMNIMELPMIEITPPINKVYLLPLLSLKYPQIGEEIPFINTCNDINRKAKTTAKLAAPFKKNKFSIYGLNSARPIPPGMPNNRFIMKIFAVDL